MVGETLNERSASSTGVSFMSGGGVVGFVCSDSSFSSNISGWVVSGFS